jgi:glutaredoxin
MTCVGQSRIRQNRSTPAGKARGGDRGSTDCDLQSSHSVRLLTATIVLAGLLAAPLGVAAQPTAAEPVRIDLFTREGCPHCDTARRFLAQLADRRPEIEIVEHDVIADSGALQRLKALAAEAQVEQPGVPAMYVSERLFVGFGSADTTGRDIEDWLDNRRQRERGVKIPIVGHVSSDEVGLPLFSLLLGLADGFNPCAMWVLLFLLSMLVNLRSRARMAWIAGTFVAVSGVVYFAFMAAWLNLFLFLGAARWIQLALGTVAIVIASIHIKDCFALGKGISLSIPRSAKPGIYARVRRILQAEHLGAALGLAVVLAVMVNMVELLCSAGIPADYAQVLASHDLPWWKSYSLMGLYIAAYVLDDSAMVAVAVVTLSKRKLQERGGRILELVSGAIMLMLGLLLVFRPAWLLWR